MNEVTIDKSFLLDVLKSGPGCVVVLHKENFKIEYCNNQFIDIFCGGSLNYTEETHSLAEMLDEGQLERLKTQLQSVTNDPYARNKYMVYKLKWKEITVQGYIYAAPLISSDKIDRGLYQLLLLSDISKWHLPFISFDSRELFFQQFNNINFGTFEWLMAQSKVFWTDGVYDIYELEKGSSTLSFSFIDSHVHPDDKDEISAAIQATVNDNKTLDVEYRIVTKKNNIKYLHVVGKVIYDGNGNLEKLVGSVRDITQQRKIEEELRSSVKVLNRSNKDLEEFAYIASHDMQEPLRKISTFSDRLYEKYNQVLTGDGNLYLERIMASAENMRTLINNLLEFSRISKSTQPFAYLNLNFILQQVKTDLELKIEETGTIINTTQLPIVHGSIIQMKQVFENIITNAIKFRKENVTPVIDISSSIISPEEVAERRLLPGSVYHKIQITDNGIGFEDEYASRIFQIFQRLHGKTEYPGSGIGLAICKKILEHHNGMIYAENIPNVGARFNFIIPESQPEPLNKS